MALVAGWRYHGDKWLDVGCFDGRITKRRRQRRDMSAFFTRRAMHLPERGSVEYTDTLFSPGLVWSGSPAVDVPPFWYRCHLRRHYDMPTGRYVGKQRRNRDRNRDSRVQCRRRKRQRTLRRRQRRPGIARGGEVCCSWWLLGDSGGRFWLWSWLGVFVVALVLVHRWAVVLEGRRFCGMLDGRGVDGALDLRRQREGWWW